MSDKTPNTKIHTIIALAVIVTAIVLGLTKWKLPAKHVKIPSSSSLTNSSVNTSSWSYPGKLPDEQIGNKQVRMQTSKGEIIIKLDAAQSPIAVSNFVYLAGVKFYDGILWHRVESWVVQAGDPQTKDASVDETLWGRGGPGYTIPDEPVTGEYTAGTVAMAKTDAPNSAGSQFFILLVDTPLPKTYQILGQVTTGMDVVKTLIKGDKILSVVVEPAS